MASVYEAIHEPSGQRSAVKVLHQMFAQNQEVLNRFFNEAKAANAVEHPAIVCIHECGMTLSGVAYLAMEYIDGVNLHERLYHVGGILPEITAIQITQQIASALSAAHEKGIVHRDAYTFSILCFDVRYMAIQRRRNRDDIFTAAIGSTG